MDITDVPRSSSSRARTAGTQEGVSPDKCPQVSGLQTEEGEDLALRCEEPQGGVSRRPRTPDTQRDSVLMASGASEGQGLPQWPVTSPLGDAS